MKKIIIVLLLVSTLLVLTSCGKASTEAPDTTQKANVTDSMATLKVTQPYGVDDRFLGCWTMTDEDGDESAVLFLPNGDAYISDLSDRGYWIEADELVEKGTWYTAEPQILTLNTESSTMVFKYTFVDDNTLTVTFGKVDNGIAVAAEEPVEEPVEIPAWNGDWEEATEPVEIPAWNGDGEEATAPVEDTAEPIVKRSGTYILTRTTEHFADIAY